MRFSRKHNKSRQARSLSETGHIVSLQRKRGEAMKCATILLAVILLMPISCTSFASDREGIIARCRTQMAECGSAMVKASVDQDLEALHATASYPEKAKPFIARCHKQMAEYGWAMVKACTDQDIEAEKSLGGY